MPARSDTVTGATGRLSPPAADEAQIELAADDGTADGAGLLEDGLMVVTRLTPRAYPIRLTKIRLQFVKFAGEPSPVGQPARLIVFLDPEGSGTPPNSPRFLVTTSIAIPRTGEWVDFPVDGPTVDKGDVYVGYQALRPAQGVGFGADTNGPPRRRGFWSTDDGVSFRGPLEFEDGGQVNPLMRALGVWASPNGPSTEELSTDDGTLEAGILRNGGIYVNRLTPSRYPAKIEKLRIYVPTFEGQPAPKGQPLRLLVFRDAEPTGALPAKPAFEIDKTVQLTGASQWLDVPVDLTVASGDIWAGAQAPNPHGGVGFAVDLDGVQASRSYRSTDGGATFSGPIEVEITDGTYGLANLLIRAVVRYSETPPAFQLETNRDSLDLSEGDAASFEVRLAPGTAVDEVALAAQVLPADEAVRVSVEPTVIRPGETALVTLALGGSVASDSLRVTVTGLAVSGRSTVEVLACPWKLLATETIGPLGGRIAAGEASVTLPPGSLPGETQLRLYRGKPPTGMEEYHGSDIYHLGGLPGSYVGNLTFTQLPRASAAAVRAALKWPTAEAAPGPVVALLTQQPNQLAGKMSPVIQLAGAAPGQQSATVNTAKSPLGKRFTFWFVSGYYGAQTAQGRFFLYYPITYKEAATQVGNWLEEAADWMASENIGIDFTAHLSPPVSVTLNNLKDGVTGECDGKALWFNTKYLKPDDAMGSFASTPSHEFMHLVEALFGGNAPWSASWYKTYPWYWMDEALSTWYEPIAMKNPSYIPTTVCPDCSSGILKSDNYATFPGRGLARPPGGSADQDHGYGASMFLTSAAKRNDRMIATLIRQRSTSEDPASQLARALGGLNQLGKEWGIFGAEFANGLIYPGRSFPTPQNLAAMRTETFAMFKDVTADEHRFLWYHAPELSLRVWGGHFQAANRVPSVTDELVLAAKIEEVSDDIELHVRSESPTASKYVGSAAGGREVLIPEVGQLTAARGSILMVVVNKAATADFSTTRDLHLWIGLAEPTVTITPDYSRMQGVIGYEYTFGTKNRNIPDDALYSWQIGGTSFSTRNAKQKFSNAGTYTVEVTARFGTRTATDRIEFIVAPDSTVKKAEVLFEVFRQLKTPVGNSRQACNEYTISIFDGKQNLVDAGSSIARNGAYEAILPVASGYEYRVRYNYTSPCADSGTRSGKFDVKADTINSVRIETPPCEKN